MKKKQVKIRKIPLEPYIDMLMNLYERGVLYIDMLATPDAKSDSLMILVRDDYIEEGYEPLEESPYNHQEEQQLPLTEEILNSLI